MAERVDHGGARGVAHGDEARGRHVLRVVVGEADALDGQLSFGGRQRVEALDVEAGAAERLIELRVVAAVAELREEAAPVEPGARHEREVDRRRVEEDVPDVEHLLGLAGDGGAIGAGRALE